MTIEGGRPQAKTENRYSKDKINDGVDFARSLIKRGILSQEEVDAIVSAQDRLNEGASSDADNHLLMKWADKAVWARMGEQNDARLRRDVVQEIGRNALEDIEGSGNAVDTAMKTHLLETDAPDPAEVLALWRDFGNNLSARLSSQNLRDPRKVEDALRLANALLQAEPTIEGEDAARQGIEALKRRYRV